MVLLSMKLCSFRTPLLSSRLDQLDWGSKGRVGDQEAKKNCFLGTNRLMAKGQYYAIWKDGKMVKIYVPPGSAGLGVEGAGGRKRSNFFLFLRHETSCGKRTVLCYLEGGQNSKNIYGTDERTGRRLTSFIFRYRFFVFLNFYIFSFVFLVCLIKNYVMEKYES